MKRFITLISFLLLVTTVIFWVRSYRRADIGALFVHKGRVQAVGSHRGQIHFFFSDLKLASPARAWTVDATTGTLEEFASLRDALFDLPIVDRGMLGFRLVKGSPKSLWTPTTHWTVVLPHSFLTLLFALPPAAWLRHRLTLYRRRRRRLCLHCAYDLRSSTDRCPECGEPIDSAANTPAASR